MPAANTKVAAVFDEIADLPELQDANTFRIRACRRAARQVQGLGRNVAKMLERGKNLYALPGIGRDLADNIAEIVATGSCAQLERLPDGPCFSILAQPTTRLIDESPPADVDLQRVLCKARERGCFVEFNSQPSRLDLPDAACRLARDEGVLVSIASDAHGADDFGHLLLGIGQARRGWLAPSDVLNTRSLPQLRILRDATLDRGRRNAAARPAVPATTVA